MRGKTGFWRLCCRGFMRGVFMLLRGRGIVDALLVWGGMGGVLFIGRSGGRAEVVVVAAVEEEVERARGTWMENRQMVH